MPSFKFFLFLVLIQSKVCLGEENFLDNLNFADELSQGESVNNDNQQQEYDQNEENQQEGQTQENQNQENQQEGQNQENFVQENEFLLENEDLAQEKLNNNVVDNTEVNEQKSYQEDKDSIHASREPVRAKKGSITLEDFKKYFANLKAGHPEGVYFVTVRNCPVYEFPNRKSLVKDTLDYKDEVHVLKELKSGWTKIGRQRYVESKNIKTYGLTTPGISFYKK